MNRSKIESPTPVKFTQGDFSRKVSPGSEWLDQVENSLGALGKSETASFKTESERARLPRVRPRRVLMRCQRRYPMSGVLGTRPTRASGRYHQPSRMEQAMLQSESPAKAVDSSSKAEKNKPETAPKGSTKASTPETDQRGYFEKKTGVTLNELYASMGKLRSP